MSKLSNIQSQNDQPMLSHRNQPHATPVAHSQQPNAAGGGRAQKEWVATYIDGQYFLTDPESMNKLRNIEAQIQEQRNRLAKLQHQNISNNNSFLSYQEQAQERHSNNSFCDTEYHPTKHLNKQERVKNQLEKEEELYRQKLKNMQREKQDLKKNMKLLPTQGFHQAQPSQRKSSVKKQGIEQQSKSKKHQEIKEKSYHKSRIEKSIKDNIALNEEDVASPQKSVKGQSQQQQVNARPAKSVKLEQTENKLQVQGSTRKQAIVASSKKEPIGSAKKEPSVKEASHVSKSIKVVVLEPNGHQLDIDKESEIKQQPQKSVKGELSPQKSVKKSMKGEEKSVKASQREVKNDDKSVKIEHSSKAQQKSVKAAPSVKNDQKSKKASQKSMNLQVKQELESPQKSMKNSNIDKKSQKLSQNLQISPQKSQRSRQLLQLQQPKHSQRKSIKKSQKPSNYEKAQSQKPQPSVKVSQKPAPSVRMVQVINQNRSQRQAPSHISQKQAIVNESPTKSVKRSSVKASSKNKLIVNQQPQIAKSIRSKVNEVIDINEVEKQSVKSVPRSNLVVEREEEVKSRRSNAIQEIKSKKSHQMEQQVKSKRSYLNTNKVQEFDAKSKKSQQPQTVVISPQKQEIKSMKNEDVVSHKSSAKSHQQIHSVKQEIVVQEPVQESRAQVSSKKSVKVSNSQVLSQKSSKEEVVSKKSSKQSPQKSQQQQLNKSSISSQKPSFSKKQVSPLIQLKQSPQKQQIHLVDQSIQYSRVTEQPPSNPITLQQQQTPSEKNSSFIIQNNDMSMNQSSHLKLQMLQNQLKPQVQDLPPHQYNMKKKKEEAGQNQSEKKSKSFIIHSRQGSVKDRSQKLNNSKASPSRKRKDHSFNESSVINQSVQSATKQQIGKLHQQILLLQEKLKKVQDRQEQLQKLQGTISKIQHNQQARKDQEKEESRVKPQSPMIENLTELSIAAKAQPRLQIQSSILQVNTTDDIKKKQEKEVQHSEKSKLKDQIGRLKRIIRDMQIQKIKSIDHEAEGQSPTLRPRNFDGKQSRELDRQSRVQKESIASFQGVSSVQRRFGSNNKRLLQDAGKIMHNASYLQKPIETPKRRSIQKMRLMGEDEVVTDPIQLPTNSSNKKNKLYSEVRKNDLINRLGDKQKDFHNFIESSRVIAQENTNNKPDAVQPIVTPFKNFSRLSVGADSGKMNYSRMVEQMKKNNPQDEQVLPQIHMRDIKMPNLPPTPHANMTQQQLLALAKATYLVFGINVDEQDKQLCVKKYKNCVIFTLNNQSHQCILWHFSGKFYMGGWRTGEPGQGEKDGQGLEYIPDRHLYKGQFLNGKKNGTGILKLSNGNIYDGQWIEGVKNGRGVYLDAATKVIYSGEWRDGKKQGQGFLKLSQKEYYYGTFLKSIKESFGVQLFVNGDKYKGEYKNGKFHGKGKYIWANGSCYEGQFSQGVRDGQGSWKSAKVNGDIYIGTYEKDKKNGYGRYVWANGCMYQGGFSQDVKHGKGRLTYQDGKEIKGIWEDGNLISTQNEKAIEHEDQPLRRSVKVTAFGYPNSSKRI